MEGLIRDGITRCSANRIRVIQAFSLVSRCVLPRGIFGRVPAFLRTPLHRIIFFIGGTFRNYCSTTPLFRYSWRKPLKTNAKKPAPVGKLQLGEIGRVGNSFFRKRDFPPGKSPTVPIDGDEVTIR